MLNNSDTMKGMSLPITAIIFHSLWSALGQKSHVKSTHTDNELSEKCISRTQMRKRTRKYADG